MLPEGLENLTEMGDVQNAPKIDRVVSAYKNLSECFKPPGKNFNKQYYHIYNVRVQKMRPLLLDRVRRKWGDTYPVCKLGEILKQNGQPCIITGTIFKDQQYKPSILKDLCEENQLVPQPPRSHCADDSDKLFLEDELQRIQLQGTLDVQDIVTGVVCAVLGHDIGVGKFEVEDILFVNCSTQIERPLLTDDRYIVLTSGWDLTNTEVPLLSLQLFIDWISGLTGNIRQQEDVSKIVRLIIAGNSIRSRPDASNKKNLISKNTETQQTFEAVTLFDDFLEQLTNVINVDVMPGEFDPSNYMLPQQPLHYCMFPKSNKLSTLNSVVNPYWFEIGGVKIMGSSGQPINDLAKFSNITDPLKGLQKCIEWAHICPTAPDTLSCYPYYEQDPFVLSECPHVFFAGNQADFSTKLYKGPEDQTTRLICIPEFFKTNTVVMLNLRTLDCYPMSFKIDVPEK